MKPIITFAAALALSPPAVANLPSNLAEFEALYNSSAADMAEKGVSPERNCFKDRHCELVLSHEVEPGRYLATLDISFADGFHVREICDGTLSERTCVFSDGHVVQQTRNGGDWSVSRTLADHFGR
jgi:hypothetical protein